MEFATISRYSSAKFRRILSFWFATVLCWRVLIRYLYIVAMSLDVLAAVACFIAVVVESRVVTNAVDAVHDIPGAGLTACSQPNYTHFPFCNTTLNIESRIHDLIGRIKDADKPGLLTARGLQAVPYLGVPPYYWGQNCIHR